MSTETSPELLARDAESLAREHFGLDGAAEALPGWEGQNFHLKCADGRSFVLKVTESEENASALEAQTAALVWLEEHAPELGCPRVVQSVHGERMVRISRNGATTLLRLLTYVEGAPLAKRDPPDVRTLRAVGAYLGRLDAALSDFRHPGARRRHLWDLAAAPNVIATHLPFVTDTRRVAQIRRHVSRTASPFVAGIPLVRTAVIHGDANDHNIVIDTDDDAGRVAAIIDFGDLAESKLVFDVAIAATYAMLDRDDPIGASASVVAGFHSTNPLTPHEIELIHPCIVLRLCTSVCLSAFRSSQGDADPYLTISEAPAWRLLERLESISPYAFTRIMREACEVDETDTEPDGDDVQVNVLQQRAAHVSSVLRLSYATPIHVMRGSMQYLYDDARREYLDSVNNVCHVGHCHPRVVAAASDQFAKLNTNTRYLYRVLGEYAERLCSLFPDPLSVCYLVNSGSEANDLALRLARAHTDGRDVVVLRGAYHGNLTSLIDISPYKHSGPGGSGPPDWVHVADLPDVYRGAHRDVSTAGSRYAEDVQRCVNQIVQGGNGLAAFICESLPSCAGQIVMPPGYLREAYDTIRAAGGVCVADEVQVGFGRVGSVFWGFETHGVVPDIVTLGKPIGNGHPMGAVVTTREIAKSFDNGMEYFNTFGGNPVSCAVGLAVLDVIEDEALQANALDVGRHLASGLRHLAESNANIGDVRGEGLFLGVELVIDAAGQQPAGRQTQEVLESMKQRGVLASRDGLFNNVIKIKPPMCFTRENADRYIDALREGLTRFEI